jgi:outer membrane lipoprotein-sorting protein
MAMLPEFADGPAVEPRAKLILDEMEKAYRTVQTLAQETTYSGGSSSQSRLFFQRPNRIAIDMGSGGSPSRRVVCDGKYMYFYSQADNQYSTDKAPRKLADLPFMAGGLELAGLAGLDAIGPLLKQAKTVKVGDPIQVDGVLNDVVILDMTNDVRTGELRLYSSQADHLLRRFEFQSKTIVKPDAKPAQPETPLEPGELPLEPSNGALPVKFSYENRVTANKEIPKEAFKWVQPPGASLAHNNPNDYKVQSRKGKPLYTSVAEPLDLANPTDPLDVHKEAKKVYASDLYKQAQKQRKK